jgi:DNA-binding FrmR family transcriptional regulator
MLPEYKKEADLRLKVAAGHLEGVRRMVDQDAYCVDLMKQLSAVQGTLQRVQQIFLRNHLSTCVSDAIKNGMGDAVIDELMAALKYDTSLIDGRSGPGLGLPPEGDSEPSSAQTLTPTPAQESGAHCCAPAPKSA